MPDLPSQIPRRPRRLRKFRRNGVAVKLDGWYVGRPGLFANPFQGRFKHARSVELHRAWLEGRISALALGGSASAPRKSTCCCACEPASAARCRTCAART
jgi:hypothetical protein